MLPKKEEEQKEPLSPSSAISVSVEDLIVIGRTPLHFTALDGNIEAITLLLKNPKSAEWLQAKDEHGDTPLHLAIKNPDAVRAILEGSGELLRPLLLEQNGKKNTILHLAARYNYVGTVDVIGSIADHELFKELLEAKDSKDRTPLHLATERGCLGVVSIIVNAFKPALVWSPSDVAASPTDSPAEKYASELTELLKITDENGYTPLHSSIECEDTETAKTLAAECPEALVIRSKKGFTPLHLAAKEADVGSIELLVSSDIKRQALIIQDEYGRTPLYLAIEKNCYGDEAFEAVRKLANCETLLVADVDGNTPLHIAMREGLSEIAILLESFDHHCNALLVQNYQGNTPLHVAAINRRFELIEKTLADANLTILSLQNFRGDTPLHLAVIIKHSPIAKLLVERNHQVLVISNSKGYTPLQIAAITGQNDLVKIFADLCSPDDLMAKNCAVIWLAIEHCDVEAIRILAEKTPGALTMANELGQTLLHKAVCINRPEVAELLVKMNPSLLTRTDRSGFTPLHKAILSKSDGMVKIFAEVEVVSEALKIRASDDNSYTPIYRAVLSCTAETVRILAEKDFMALATPGFTPLHMAILRGFADKALILAECNPQALVCTSDDGNTPLHLAVQSGNDNVVLIRTLASRNKKALIIQNSAGHSPLHLAASLNQITVVKILIEAAKSGEREGFDSLHMADHDGNTPLSYLVEHNDLDNIIELIVTDRGLLLTKYGASENIICFAIDNDRTKLALFLIEKISEIDPIILTTVMADDNTWLDLAIAKNQLEITVKLILCLPEAWLEEKRATGVFEKAYTLFGSASTESPVLPGRLSCSDTIMQMTKAAKKHLQEIEYAVDDAAPAPLVHI